jgi:hypothetical protein
MRPKRKQKSGRIGWLAAMGIMAVVLAGWLGLRTFQTSSSNRIPGPIGGPEIARDVNTLVGRKAPSFSLRDGEGRTYSVVPGRGKPIVVISHMGFY